MTHYETLGVSPQATQEQITAAYQTLTKKFKVFGEAPGSDKFKRLDKAYEVLSDASARKSYNEHISDPNNRKKVRVQAHKNRKKKGAYDDRNVVSILIILSIILGIFFTLAFGTFYMMLLPVATTLIGMISLWRSGKVTREPVDLEGGASEVKSNIVEGIIDGLFD
ncbi:MAG TPA: hypothetical protein DCS93_35350 [Microscillaceae bacterium]|nr:hypothetical protein [Microscillaceae bacterium]